MKMLSFLPMLILLAVCSCGGLFTNEDVQESIPGVYIRFSEHEYGREYDTILITSQNKPSKEYKMVRKWKYGRVMDQVSIEPEYKTFTDVGIYNVEDKILVETRTGSHFSFDVKNKLLFKGSTVYKKIK